MNGQIAGQPTIIPPISAAEQRMQVEKVLRSEVFRSSPSLRRFLEHVATKSIDGASSEIKESTIGIEVFGRTADYDPRIDTVVRVQAHRLREKLNQYYNKEGTKDEILLVIPKGRYVPHFSRRMAVTSRVSKSLDPSSVAEDPGIFSQAPTSASAPSPPSKLSLATTQRKIPFLWFSAGLGATTLLLGLGLLIPHLFGERLTANRSQDENHAANLNKPLESFWAAFLSDQSSTLIGYSNAVFLATESTDLLRVKKEEPGELGLTEDTEAARGLAASPRILERAGPVFYNDAYTGTGEVMAVYFLTRMFGELHSTLGVKRSRMINADDLRRHDLIFLGSINENSMVGLHMADDLAFAWCPDAGAFGGKILNRHPLPGEKSAYAVERDPYDEAVRTDYALVSFLPGVEPDRKVAILAGLTTIGTQAAADFVTSPTHVADLVAHLKANYDTFRAAPIAAAFRMGPRSNDGNPSINSGASSVPRFFQAVLRVKVVRGDVLSVEYVTGHGIAP